MKKHFFATVSLCIFSRLALADITVPPGQFLYGYDIPDNVINDGTVCPGNGKNPGTMTIHGTYTQNVYGALEIFGDFNQLSELIVIDAATINGELFVNAYNVGNSLEGPILLSRTSINGTFKNLNILPVQFEGRITYGNPITLELALHVPTAQQTVIGNSHQVKAASDNNAFFLLTNQMGRMHRSLRRVSSGELVSAGQDFSASKMHQNSGKTLSSTAADVMPVLNPIHRSHYVPGENTHLIADSNFQTQEKQQQLARTIQTPNKDYPAHFYAGPTGIVGKADGNDFWAAGSLLGFDYAFSQVGAGVLLKYNHISLDNLVIDEARAKLYATYVPEQLPQIAVNAMFGYGYDWFFYHTKKGFRAEDFTAKATPEGYQYDALVGLEYTLDKSQITGMADGLQISPWATLRYVNNHVRKSREHGAGFFDQEFSSTTEQSLRLSMEVITYYTKTWNYFTFSPEIMLGWQREFLSKGEKIGFRPVGSADPYTYLDIKSPGRNFAVAGIDLQFYFFEQYGIETSWNFEWNSLYYDNQFYLGFNYLF